MDDNEYMDVPAFLVYRPPLLCHRWLHCLDRKDVIMKERNLAYWKSRKVDVRNCIAAADKRSSYWAELWNAYRFASSKVEQAERKILVRHI